MPRLARMGTQTMGKGSTNLMGKGTKGRFATGCVIYERSASQDSFLLPPMDPPVSCVSLF